MHSLKGKFALITGGTSGIGLVVAQNYIDNGANVIITGRRADGAEIAHQIGAHFLACDVCDDKQVADLLATAEQYFGGKLDILVINAGVALDEGSIEEIAIADAKRMIDTNLLGTLNGLKFGPRHINEGGAIIVTGSVAGSGITHGGAGVYAASKAGAAYLVRTAAIENAPRAIRVNAVCPAMIAGTGMMVCEDDPMAEFLSSLTALGRMGRQHEVTGIYNFLASDSASFITGQEIRVDGGTSAGFGLPLFEKLAG